MQPSSSCENRLSRSLLLQSRRQSSGFNVLQEQGYILFHLREFLFLPPSFSLSLSRSVVINRLARILKLPPEKYNVKGLHVNSYITVGKRLVPEGSRWTIITHVPTLETFNGNSLGFRLQRTVSFLSLSN